MDYLFLKRKEGSLSPGFYIKEYDSVTCLCFISYDSEHGILIKESSIYDIVYNLKYIEFIFVNLLGNFSQEKLKKILIETIKISPKELTFMVDLMSENPGDIHPIPLPLRLKKVIIPRNEPIYTPNTTDINTIMDCFVNQTKKRKR